MGIPKVFHFTNLNQVKLDVYGGFDCVRSRLGGEKKSLAVIYYPFLDKLRVHSGHCAVVKIEPNKPRYIYLLGISLILLES